MNDKIFNIDGLSIDFRTPTGTFSAVDNLTLAIGYDEAVGIIGESGCGKSTLAYAMMGGIMVATVLTILPEALREFNDYRMVVYSAMLIIVMIFKPTGLMGTYDLSLSHLLEKFLNFATGRRGEKKEAEVHD